MEEPLTLTKHISDWSD